MVEFVKVQDSRALGFTAAVKEIYRVPVRDRVADELEAILKKVDRNIR